MGFDFIVIAPLLPSHCSFSFVFGCGVSFLVSFSVFPSMIVQQSVVIPVLSQEGWAHVLLLCHLQPISLHCGSNMRKKGRKEAGRQLAVAAICPVATVGASPSSSQLYTLRRFYCKYWQLVARRHIFGCRYTQEGNWSAPGSSPLLMTDGVLVKKYLGFLAPHLGQVGEINWIKFQLPQH